MKLLTHGILWLLTLSTPAADTPLHSVRQLTYSGERSGEGYFSSDGRFLIFQSERESGNPFYQIYLLDLESGESRRVSPGIGKTTCAFFRPGTRRVLFASTHLDPEAGAKQEAELEFRASGRTRRYSWDYDEAMDIFSANRDGSGIKRLTGSPGYDAEAAYSPDGNRIVFCSLRSAFPLSELPEKDLRIYRTDPAWFGEIWIMNADGSEPRRLTRSPGYDGGPFFLPDGEHIVWRRFDETGMVADIYTMRTDGTGERRLTDFGSMSWAPYFHPSGAYAIFASNKEGFGNFELYLVDRDGEREPIRITDADGFDGLPVFSPDGASLCWTSNRNAAGRSQLYLGQWDHELALQLLSGSPRRTGGALREPPDLSPEIRVSDHRAHVGFLASEALEGRATGSPGIEAAAAYARERFREAGLAGIGLPPRHDHSFEFTRKVGTSEEGNWLRIGTEGGTKREFEVERDFRPLSFTDPGEWSGEGMVFAGYGLHVPGPLGEGYDSYAGLYVKDKVVLILRYVPEDVSPERRQVLNRYAGLRYKAMLARERGARALLVVTGPNSPGAGQLVKHHYDQSPTGSGILAASISGEVARWFLSSAGKDLEKIQTSLDRENPHAEGGFELPGITLELGAGIRRETDTDVNVLGYLSPPESSEEYIIVGAHMDHLGRGGSGSLQRQGEDDSIHYGADDNASGTSVVLELAAGLSAWRKEQPEDFRRGILFALWSGEEIGLVGSTRFAEDYRDSLGEAVAYINFDMVGRLRDNRLVLQGVGSSDSWTGLIESKNVAAGFDLALQEDPYLPTDAMVFYNRDIPILNFFTGSHEDYHRPTDTPDRINYQGLHDISEFARRLVLDLAGREEAPAFVKVDARDTGGNRERLRVYLGTIPDYVAEVEGVKISGVWSGGPAEEAGLQAQDIIVGFAGRKITNIYDYTYAIDAAKAGEEVPITVLRGGREVSLKIVPRVR